MTTMTTKPNPMRRSVRAPLRLPMWMQVGVVALLLAQSVQTALHFYSSRVAQTAYASSPQNLSRFEYVYQPDRLHSATPQEQLL
jgi:hypothetical protein